MYRTAQGKWYPSKNKLTKFEIFSYALDVKKMKEFTKGEGFGDDWVSATAVVQEGADNVLDMFDFVA